MNSRDLIQMSMGNLIRRKTRTVLTVLGVVIGTSSIVIMLSLGIAMDKGFQEDLASMGSLNIIDVNAGMQGPEIGTPDKNRARLDDKAVEQFEQIEGVVGVMPTKSTYMKIAAGKMVSSQTIVGIRPKDMEAFDFDLEEGRLLLETDKDALVFGSQVPYNFYNPRLRANQDEMYGMYGMEPGTEPPKPQVKLVGGKLMLTSDMEYGERRSTQSTTDKAPRLFEAKGVGVLKQSNSEKDYQVYMNLSELERMAKEDQRSTQGERPRQTGQENQYETIKVKVKDIEQVEGVQKVIKAMGFQTNSLTDMLDSMKKTSRTIQAILGGIGAVSLLVAAIGITNTMVMSIYERTREIGIIKVLGADILDIKRMFLLEAAMIGFGGGLLGLVFSYAVSAILNKVALQSMGGMGMSRAISVISPGLALGALAFATIIGLISGYAPARRAMNLSSLEAIRSE